nr:MAG: major capsid protein [Microvirus sp.]
MTRQSSTPVPFEQTMRPDNEVIMTSGRAGVVVPVGYIPLLPGESMAGKLGMDFKLAEMPRPLLNRVWANVQAWFVPKSAMPQFPGRDELNHAMLGLPIKSLGAADRTPPAFFTTISGASLVTAAGSEMFKALGLHVPTGATINTDLIDAFNLVYNFRLAAHSSRLTRRQYASESIADATTLPPAFWPSGRFAHVVPDYEQALVQGALDLDLLAGSLPVEGLAFYGSPTGGIAASTIMRQTAPMANDTAAAGEWIGAGSTGLGVAVRSDGAAAASAKPSVRVSLSGQTLSVTLNDIDKARITQAYAKLHRAYAGNDATGFDNDDVLVALLMQGIDPGAENFKRPWLLSAARVPVNFVERFASDAANLDDSVTVGMASVALDLNVPKTDVGGVVIYTVEVLPERLDERMSDEWVLCTDFNDYPNPLRDIQRTLPVDMVLNRRIDAKHTTPDGLYGYEPMNMKWKRDFTRLGGIFYEATPGAVITESRMGLWQTDIVNPEFEGTHHLAPVPFPHDVFADTLAPAFEVVARHVCSIVGNVQFGDVLTEANDDYAAVEESGV